MEKTGKKATMKAGNGKIPLNNGTKIPLNNDEKKVARRRNAHNASLVARTAEITGKSERYVYMVAKGERNNEEIDLVMSELHEGGNKLVEAVRSLLPFDGPRDVEVVVKYLPGKEADEFLGRNN